MVSEVNKWVPHKEVHLSRRKFSDPLHPYPFDKFYVSDPGRVLKTLL